MSNQSKTIIHQTTNLIAPMRAVALAGLIAGLMSGCGGGGDSGSAAKTSSVPNSAPIAVAQVSGEAVANAPTALSASGSIDSDGVIASKSWDYGDGQSGAADSHIYTAPGTYKAKLTVTDDKGASSNKSFDVVVAKCSAAGTAAAAASALTTVCVQTTAGEMVFELDGVHAPISASNFMKYVNDGFYANTIFHRVELAPNFVIQGGGFVSGLTLKVPTYPAIALESNNGLSNLKYTLGMARTNQVNSATSQFYVNLADNRGFDYVASNPLPNGYAVFGKVISGTAVVDAMSVVPTKTVNGVPHVPQQDLVIRSIIQMP